MPLTQTQPLWRVDDAHDLDQASDGFSRFGAYLSTRTHDLDLEWSAPADRAFSFACWAWRIATPPVMSPGYVRLGPAIESAILWRDSYEGLPAAAVTVCAPLPPALAATRGGWRGWARDNGVEPDHRGLFRCALPTVRLEAAVGGWQWPDPPAELADVRALVAAAKLAVHTAISAFDATFADAVDAVAVAS
jgi:hypothetical protein